MFNKLPSFVLILFISALTSFLLYITLPTIFPYFTLKTEDMAASFAIILILTSALYSAFSEGRVKKFLIYLAIWLFIALFAIILYNFKADFGSIAARVASSIFPSYGINHKPGEILVSRSMDGHFYIQVTINGTLVKFMIDTGASDVALTKADAQRLNFDLSKLNYSKVYSTANGLSYAAPVVLKSFAVGPKIFQDVAASVASGENDISLLGMSVISRFKSFRIDGNTLVLSY
jgi:aspartyl protease family protein